jgi:hypothetical protein
MLETMSVHIPALCDLRKPWGPGGRLDPHFLAPSLRDGTWVDTVSWPLQTALPMAWKTRGLGACLALASAILMGSVAADEFNEVDTSRLQSE